MSRTVTPEAPPVDRLQDDFERAAEAAGGRVDLHLALAGKPVRIRFAGARVAEALSQAFAHLEAREDESPALTLHVWDSGLRGAETAGAGASYYSEQAGVRTLHQPASGVFSVLDADAETGWFWMPEDRKSVV